MKKKSLIIFCVVLLSLVVGTGFLVKYVNAVQKYQKEVAVITYDHVDAKGIADGVYIGECDVNYIYAKVAVTVVNETIADVAIVEHRHDRGANAESVVQEMVRQQKIDVDAVAGATNSSKVLKAAADNALNGLSVP